MVFKDEIPREPNQPKPRAGSGLSSKKTYITVGLLILFVIVIVASV